MRGMTQTRLLSGAVEATTAAVAVVVGLLLVLEIVLIVITMAVFVVRGVYLPL